jgi:hypothetical protein
LRILHDKDLGENKKSALIMGTGSLSKQMKYIEKWYLITSRSAWRE